MTKHPPSASGTRSSYYVALGLFIEQFAITEALVQMLLWHYADVGSNVGKAVFSGVRTRTAIDSIKRIVSVNDPGEPLRSDLTNFLAQLSAINAARNRVIHFTPEGITENGRIITDAIRALSPAKVKREELSADVLNALTVDLQKISVHVGYHLIYRRGPPEIIREYAEQLGAPWQYTPASQADRQEERP